MGNHDSYYKQNQQYADFLANWDPKFYAKYTDNLKPEKPGGRCLDVGCGAGQVVANLDKDGFEAYGVDVSEPNIAYAQQHSNRCSVYDGKHLPFPDNFFASAGALNVLEHVEEPEAFIQEIVRVVEPGGKIILSSPNFFRALGFKDYHPKMRGLRNKLANWKRLREKRCQMREAPETAKFDRMTPIVKEPFTPDDDAIIATNPLEISYFLEQAGCQILRLECTDRYVPKPLDFLLNLTPLRYVMFNGFVLAKKRE